MSIREERERAQSAQGILEKQRSRCLDAASALRQWIGFIRTSDLRPEDLTLLASCDAYLESERRPVTREDGEAIRYQERAG